MQIKGREWGKPEIKTPLGFLWRVCYTIQIGFRLRGWLQNHPRKTSCWHSCLFPTCKKEKKGVGHTLLLRETGVSKGLPPNWEALPCIPKWNGGWGCSAAKGKVICTFGDYLVDCRLLLNRTPIFCWARCRKSATEASPITVSPGLQKISTSEFLLVAHQLEINIKTQTT